MSPFASLRVLGLTVLLAATGCASDGARRPASVTAAGEARPRTVLESNRDGRTAQSAQTAVFAAFSGRDPLEVPVERYDPLDPDVMIASRARRTDPAPWGEGQDGQVRVVADDDGRGVRIAALPVPLSNSFVLELGAQDLVDRSFPVPHDDRRLQLMLGFRFRF